MYEKMELFESLQFCSTEFLTSSKEQARVLAFFDQLRNSENGWRSCIDVIAKELTNEDQLKFLCLQVVEHFLKTRYVHANGDDINLIRSLMLRWLEQIQRDGSLVPFFLKNKMAQLFSLIFIVDFPQRWPSFLHDVFLSKLYDDSIIEFYLRVLLAIDTEVADREIQRTKEEGERNTLIRDRMREVCVIDMVGSWFQILVKYVRTNVKITNLCLNNIGAYVAWIDITLIANDRFVPLIVECLSLTEEETQEAATDCVCSILNKGMDPNLKIQLVQAMDKILQDTGVYRVDQFQDPDVDHLVKLAEIVNCIGCVLIECYSKFIKSAQSVSSSLEVLGMIEVKLPLVLVSLAQEDTLVSSCVIEFCHQYVVLLKQLVPLNLEQKKFLKDLLLVTLRRYRYPDDYNHEHEGETEVEFLEFRKELKTIFMNIGMLDGDLTMETVEELVISTYNNWRQLSYRDVELAISLLFFLGEAMPWNMFVSGDKKALCLKKMVRMMIVSGVSHQNHVAVCLQYFETVVRYDKLFAVEPDLMPDTITSFLDDRGLHHKSGKVRSRVTYLFSRFVRSQKTALQQYVGQILFHLQDLLAVSPKTTERRISAEDQLFLFETTGTLIVSGSFSPEEKRNYMQQLLGSLVTRFNEGITMLDKTADEEERRILIDYINNIMAYASRTSKAFSNQLTMKSCLCEDIFLELMTAFLSSMAPTHAPLLNGLRQYLHRMVICLENELLPHLSPVFRKFLTFVTDLKSLTDFLTLVQQAIAKYKSDIIPYLKDDMILLYSTIWHALSVQIDPSDEVATRDSQYLRRSYYQLLGVIANNKLLELWTCIGSENLKVFMALIVEGAMFIRDPIVQKQCFNMIHKGFDCCTAENVASFQWLLDFVYSQMLPACFAVPLKFEFDFEDAQSVMVVSEIGAFIKRFFEIKGEDLLNFIVQHVWTSAKLPPEAVNEFCFALKSMDTKAFQKYVKSFFERLRQRPS